MSDIEQNKRPDMASTSGAPPAGDASIGTSHGDTTIAGAATTNASAALARRHRRRLWATSAVLLVIFSVFSGVFVRYLVRPAPLPELIVPIPNVNYPPHYLFSIYGPVKPTGVTISPDGRRVYVSESEGERLVHIFDRAGKEIGRLETPNAAVGERAPVYLATDRTGRVYVTDRLQFAVFVYDQDGHYLDAIVAPDLTLSKYVLTSAAGQSAPSKISYNVYQKTVAYQAAGGKESTLPLPQVTSWAPLGIRIDSRGTVYLTDVTLEHNRVHIINLDGLLDAKTWTRFDPPSKEFGASGKQAGQFLFPNSAIADSQGRVYVSDGNNGRISVWDKNGTFLFHFAAGGGDGSVNLPRGIFIDSRDRLHVVDAVGQSIRVYDVSGTDPAYLYSFGDFGNSDGMFSYPNDIAIDGGGRLYIADRENNRVQVWSY